MLLILLQVAITANSNKLLFVEDQNTNGPSTSDDIQQLASAYRVYPFTVESPTYGSRVLITDPEDAVASPFGWHDTNGAAGAESTLTRGNNVNAYSDKDANDAVNPTTGVDRFYADGGAALNCCEAKNCCFHCF